MENSRLNKIIYADKAFTEELRNNPHKQFEYIKSIFADNWDAPENIRLALNHIAMIQGVEERLRSSDFKEIFLFAKELGFELQWTLVKT